MSEERDESNDQGDDGNNDDDHDSGEWDNDEELDGIAGDDDSQGGGGGGDEDDGNEEVVSDEEPAYDRPDEEDEQCDEGDWDEADPCDDGRDDNDESSENEQQYRYLSYAERMRRRNAEKLQVPVEVVQENEKISKMYAHEFDFIDDIFVSCKPPPLNVELKLTIRDVIKIIKKKDADKSKNEQQYLATILKARDIDINATSPFINPDACSSLINSAIENNECDPLGPADVDAATIFLEKLGITDPFEGSSTINAGAAGLESTDGRYALVRMQYNHGGKEYAVIVQGNFWAECSKYFTYCGKLVESRKDTVGSLKYGDINDNDGKVYRIEGLTVLPKAFKRDNVLQLFKDAKVPEEYMADISKQWEIIANHIAYHKEGGLCPENDPISDKQLCHVASMKVPYAHRLDRLEYMLTKALPNGQVLHTIDGEVVSTKITMSTLLATEGAKMFAMPEIITFIREVFPNKSRVFLQLDYAAIANIYKKLKYDPFSYCFRNTKPYKFFEELTFAQLQAIKKLSHDADPIANRVTDLQACACYIYHEIMLANMHGESLDKKKAEVYKWSVIKDSENSYIFEESVIDIVVNAFPGNRDANFVRNSIKELIRIGVATVEYVDMDGMVVGTGDTVYPIQRIHKIDPWPKARVMTIPAYTYTAMIARVLRGCAGRCGKKGPTESHAKLQSELGLDDVQYGGVLYAIANPVTLVTGAAGTGKTKLLIGIAESVEKDKTIVSTLMAKTGSMLTRNGLRADTMHHYISEHSNWVKANDGSPHPLCDKEVLIIDEATLSSLPVTAKFLYIMFLHGNLKHIIMAGHEWQLPSIEYGAVFTDLIEGLPDCTFRLTKYYRSKNEILFTNANKIFNFHKLKAAYRIRNILAAGSDTGSEGSANGSIVPNSDIIELDYHDDFFSFEAPGPGWTTDEGKGMKIMKCIFDEAMSMYHTTMQLMGTIGNESEVWKVDVLRECLTNALNNIHILVLQNEYADLINDFIHTSLFASGFMQRLGNPPAFLWDMIVKHCGINTQRYTDEIYGFAGNSKIANKNIDDGRPMLNAFDQLRKGSKDETASRRIRSGAKAIWPSEKFYYTKNDKEKQTRNGEVLKVDGYIDIAIEDLDQYMSKVSMTGGCISDEGCAGGTTILDENDGEGVGIPDTSMSATKMESKITYAGTKWPHVPSHTFDGISCKIKTVNYKSGGKIMKIDIYDICGPWTGYVHKEMVRMVQVSHETGEVAWCTSINRVLMEYSDPRGKTYGDVFKHRGGPDGESGTCVKFGWATTIHKYQGSEQNIIIYVIGDRVNRYANCQHAYVAVSRAKSRVKIIGTLQALSLIAAKAPVKRRTTLVEEVKRMKIMDVFKSLCSKRLASQKAIAELDISIFDTFEYDVEFGSSAFTPIGSSPNDNRDANRSGGRLTDSVLMQHDNLMKDTCQNDSFASIRETCEVKNDNPFMCWTEAISDNSMDGLPDDYIARRTQKPSSPQPSSSSQSPPRGAPSSPPQSRDIISPKKKSIANIITSPPASPMCQSHQVFVDKLVSQLKKKARGTPSPPDIDTSSDNPIPLGTMSNDDLLAFALDGI